MSSLTVSSLVTWFLQDCAARGLAPKTVTFYRERLAFLQQAFGDREPGSLSLIEVKMAIQEASAARGWSVTTTNHALVASRVFLRFLEREEVVGQTPAAKLTKIKAPEALPHPFSPQDISAMLAACGTDFAGLRNKTCLLVLLDCGLRAGELMGLTVQDVDLTACQLTVRHAKGGRGRTVPFSAPVRRLLLKYSALRHSRQPHTDAWWIAADGEPLSQSALDSFFTRNAKKAGVEGAHLHRMRHTFATQFLQQGGSLAMLQRLLGHRSLDMTLRYSHIVNLDATADHRYASPATNLLGHRYRG